ncbi:MAG TPA: L,D-transpeptidase [Thermoleophilaceae bacterium]
MRASHLLIAALAACVLALVAPAGAATGVLLSNEQTLTQWANPKSRALVRLAPDPSSRAITRLHPLTEDGFPEVYEALQQQTDAGGTSWIQIRVPMRPNGRTGWVPASALGKLHTVHTELVVQRGRLRATLYRDGRAVFRAPVGVGRPGLPTPAGHFYVRERFRIGRGGGAYGPLAFGTSAYSPKLTDWPGGGVVGIHGTNEPQLVPGRPSHGCVRMRNRDIVRLGHLMPVGTPVLIL